MPRPRGRKSATPLEAKQRELAEEEHRLQCQMAELQRTLADAPKVAAEEARRRREALLSGRGPGRASAGLGPQDKRHSGNPARSSSRLTPILKAERHAARLQTAALLVALAAVLIWLFFRFGVGIL